MRHDERPGFRSPPGQPTGGRAKPAAGTKGVQTFDRAPSARGLASAALAVTAFGPGAPTVEVGRLGGVAHGGTAAVVRGLASTSGVTLELQGATDPQGRVLRPTHLQRTLDGWRGVLPGPALVGSYPIVVRSGSHRYQHRTWLLRVYPRAALRGRTYATRGAAVRSWVERLPGDQVVVALRSWKQTALDRRDRRLNALLVIAYAPRGDTRVRDRLGMFLTLARDDPDGRWRLLLATVTPYGPR